MVDFCVGEETGANGGDHLFCKRRRLNNTLCQAATLDQSCQTEAVLIFSCARELSRFIRMNSLLLSRSEQSSQTDSAFISNVSSTQTENVEDEARQTPVFSLEDRALLLSINKRLLDVSRPLSPPPPPQLSRQIPPKLAHSHSFSEDSECELPQARRPSGLQNDAVIELDLVKEEPDCQITDMKMNSRQDMSRWEDFSRSSITSDTKLASDGENSNGPMMSSSMSCQGRPRIRAHNLYCVPNHRVVEITSFNDVRPTAPDEELRIAPLVCETLLKKSCSIGNFGWRLVSTIYRTEEMRERNYFGNRGKRPLSPRRIHAVEHAYYDYLPNEDSTLCLAEARNAINQGLRNITHNLTELNSFTGIGQMSMNHATDLLVDRRIHERKPFLHN